MAKKLVCENCGRELYLNDVEKLRDKQDHSVMCPHPDYPWHRAN